MDLLQTAAVLQNKWLSIHDLPAPEPQAPYRVKSFSRRVKEVHAVGRHPISTKEGKRREQGGEGMKMFTPISISVMHQQTLIEHLLCIPSLVLGSGEMLWSNTDRASHNPVSPGRKTTRHSPLLILLAVLSSFILTSTLKHNPHSIRHLRRAVLTRHG